MAAHVITCEYPPDCGGVSDHTEQLARALDAAGHTVHVWCPGRAAAADPAIQVHDRLGAFDRAALTRLSTALDATPGPRRLVVQWVPQGYGYRAMNVGFCLWLAGRARGGDQVDLVVHEPFVNVWTGSLRRVPLALVQRAMMVILLRVARVVWLSTPAWERLVRPFALGRALDIRWLPVPGCEVRRPPPSPQGQSPRQAPIVGHFGTFGSLVRPLLEERLLGVMEHPLRPSLRLIGRGGDTFAAHLVHQHPEWAGRIEATGQVSAEHIADALAACDLVLQPYPDGITTRRTSAMAALAQGCAVVTTTGWLTEPLWTSLEAVELVDVDDVPGFVAAADRLLRHADERRVLGARARVVYESTFSMSRLVDVLRAA